MCRFALPANQAEAPCCSARNRDGGRAPQPRRTLRQSARTSAEFPLSMLALINAMSACPLDVKDAPLKSAASLAHALRIHLRIEADFTLFRHVPRVADFLAHRNRPALVVSPESVLCQTPQNLAR